MNRSPAASTSSFDLTSPPSMGAPDMGMSHRRLKSGFAFGQLFARHDVERDDPTVFVARCTDGLRHGNAVAGVKGVAEVLESDRFHAGNQLIEVFLASSEAACRQHDRLGADLLGFGAVEHFDADDGAFFGNERRCFMFEQDFDAVFLERLFHAFEHEEPRGFIGFVCGCHVGFDRVGSDLLFRERLREVDADLLDPIDRLAARAHQCAHAVVIGVSDITSAGLGHLVIAGDEIVHGVGSFGDELPEFFVFDGLAD